MSSYSTPMFEYDGDAGSAPKDDLFLERLDTFMDKCLGEIKAFAERELRPYEETRRRIAEWHAKYLFQPSTASVDNRSEQVRATLSSASLILESLSEASGVQSFLLAVDPLEAADGGFLGGSVIGREFWRGIRGGGDNGARAFKSHCTAHLQMKPPVIERNTDTPPPKGGMARSIKNDLYESVRNALRLASGVRGAEMKWTNPERLDVYGVRLVGWPDGVPSQNPSSLKVSQNKLLLDAIQSGTMRFERSTFGQKSGDNGASKPTGDGQDEDFSWAYDADACPSAPLPQSFATLPSSSSSIHAHKNANASTNTPLNKTSEYNAWHMDPVAENDMSLSSHSVDYTWDGDTLGEEWSSELHSQLERPRKRQRSEEIYSAMDS